MPSMTYEIRAIGTAECTRSNEHSYGQNMTNICTVGKQYHNTEPKTVMCRRNEMVKRVYVC